MPAPDPAAPPDIATTHADRDALLTELAKLPRRQQAVLVLRYYEGLTDAEVADLLGCRPGTVRGYASRALAALRINSANDRAFDRGPSAVPDPKIQVCEGDSLMRTEEDLRTALATREQLAPDPGPMLEGLGQAVRRRGVRLATSSAVATLAAGAVAAVLAVPTLLTPATQLPTAPPTQRPTQPAAQTAPQPITDGHATDRPDFSFTVASSTVAGYEIRPAQLAPEQQAALVVPLGSGQTVGVVALMRPGSMADAPAGPPNSEVHNQPAWFVEDPFGHQIGTLYWVYAPDALALLSLPFPEVPAASFVPIAEGVKFVDPYPAHVPYRLEYLPADLRPIALSFDQRGARAILNLANDIGDVEPENAHPRAVGISILDNRPTPDDVLWPGYTTLPWQPPTTLGAHSVRCADAPGGLNFDDHQMCEIEFQGDILILDVFELAPAELEQVLAGLTLADLADPESWFTFTDALP